MEPLGTPPGWPKFPFPDKARPRYRFVSPSDSTGALPYAYKWIKSPASGPNWEGPEIWAGALSLPPTDRQRFYEPPPVKHNGDPIFTTAAWEFDVPGEFPPVQQFSWIPAPFPPVYISPPFIIREGLVPSGGNFFTRLKITVVIHLIGFPNDRIFYNLEPKDYCWWKWAEANGL